MVALSRNTSLDPPAELLNLNLATNVLRCARCHVLVFGWGELKEHHCLSTSFGLTPGVCQVAVAEDMMYHRPREDINHQVIRLARHDPATATIADMDTADVAYFCPPCLVHLYVPGDLVHYYSWRSIVSATFLSKDPRY